MLKNRLFPLTLRQTIITLTFILSITLPLTIPETTIENSQLIILIMVIWMVTWWVGEIIPIPITSLIPIIILPIYGIESLKSVTSHYAHPLIFLFLGGFIIAATMEHWNLHKRVALHIIHLIGKNANAIIGGFMISTALLSMWISNTATTVMMLPIGLAIITLLKESEKLPNNNPDIKAFSTCLMISIAYAANIGGTATLIGTPPNAILAAFLQEKYAIEIGFAEWFVIGFPFACVLLGIGWLILTHYLFPNNLGALPTTQSYIKKELQSLGPLSYEEKWISTIFGTTALLWIMRPLINQWLSTINTPITSLNDTSIILTAVVMLSLIKAQKKKETIIHWPAIVRIIPWGILLLFGGGLTIASSLSNTTIIETIGNIIASYDTLTWWIALLITTIIMLLFTELMSNMALTTLLLPITATIAIGFNQEPLIFLVPVTLAASCAFMMPVATPPNAIVFGSGHISMKQMIRAGIYMNSISILLIMLITLPLASLMLLGS